MFSHKPNPIFDTNETQSSRGDDYEVINLSNEALGRNGSSSSTGIAGMSGIGYSMVRPAHRRVAQELCQSGRVSMSWLCRRAIGERPWSRQRVTWAQGLA